MNRILPLLILLMCCVSFTAVRGDEYYTFVVKKQEKKRQNRWSLQDWLETKDRMMMQDIWLALHSPSPYEFFLGGSFISGRQVPGQGSYVGGDLRVGAYASIFGLELQYDQSFSHRWLGLLHLRIFGYHEQATNLTLQGGIRSQTDGGTFRGALAGVRATVYLTRFFGIEGLYRYYFPTTQNETGEHLEGQRYGGGIFIDFSFLRVWSFYFVEPTTRVAGTSRTTVDQNGVHLGVKLFF